MVQCVLAGLEDREIFKVDRNEIRRAGHGR
jgi:hypothetical protein